jgi:hypothetical protein
MTDPRDTSGHDLELGIAGFRYSDLYDAVKLRQLAELFYQEVESQDPLLGNSLDKYIAARGLGFEPRVESKILTDAAPYLSDFVARLFKVNDARAELGHTISVQNAVWKYKFFVQRRASKKFKPEQLAEMNEGRLWLAVTQLRNTAFDETLVRDEELGIAEMTMRLVDAEEFLLKPTEEMPPAVHDTVGGVQSA